MASFKICAPLTLALSACVSSPVQGETALLGGDGAQNCQPLPAPAEQVAFAQSQMTVTRDGRAMAATLALPTDTSPKAVVVFLHGYTGTRDEIKVRGGEGMFARAARAFAQQGIASLRFDFIGSGDSEGDWADTTFTGQAADTRAVIEAVRGSPGLGVVPLHLLGFSQGGLVALKATEAGLPVRSVVLWNPVLDPRQTYARIFGADGLNTGLRMASAGAFDAIVPGTRLKAAFFQEVATAAPQESGAGFTQPLLVISGSLDGIADNGAANAQKLKDRRSGSTIVLSVPGDHALGATRATGLIDEVIACSVRYVAQRSGMLLRPGTLAPLQ